MIRSIRRLAAIAALSIGGVALSTAPAHAITGGVRDGEGHPNVGLISWYDADGRFRCTATLVTPTVLLTAAHCTEGAIGKHIVTFSTFLAETKPEISPIPRAADDTGAGSSSVGFQGSGAFTNQGRTWYTGTAHSHPAYSDFTDMANWNDVGVIVLDQPVVGITPAKIAGLNYLNQFAQPKLNSTLFTIVGYGTEVRKPDSGPQKPSAESYPLVRRVAEAPGQKLTPQILQVNGNPNDIRGTGGSCFGDSGGPTFKDGKVVTVTSYGYTSNCRYLDGLQRVDIKVVQDWLATYGVTP